MADIKLLHYRDHHNGGKFNGNCYVDTNRGLLLEKTSVYVRLQFRGEELTPSESQFLLGSGAGPESIGIAYSRDSEGVYKVMIYVSSILYSLQIIPNIKKIITFEARIIRTGANTLDVYSNINESTYNYEKLSNTVPVSITYSPTITLSHGPIYLGATSVYYPSGYEPFPSFMFTGTIFNYEIENELVADDLPLYPYWESQRLSFHQEVSTPTVMIDRSGNGVDANIEDIPSDFWGDITNISSYALEGTDIKMSYSSDDYWVKEFPTLKFGLFNYTNIKTDDTIAVEIDSEIVDVFNVSEIKNKNDGLSINIECEHFLMGLEKLTPAIFSSNKTERVLYQYVKNHWWSNSDYTSSEYYSTKLTLLGLLRLIIYILDYDNILSFSSASLATIKTPFVNVLPGGSNEDLYYNQLGFSSILLEYMGANEDQYSIEPMSEIIRQIMLATRINFQVIDGVFSFAPITYSSVVTDKIWNKQAEVIGDDFSFSQIKTSYIGNAFPDLLFNPGDIPAELNELVTRNSTLLDIPEKYWQQYTFVNFFWIWKVVQSGAILTIEDIGFGVQDPLIPYDGTTFTPQLATILDNELRKTFKMERITTTLDINNIYTMNKYKELSINLGQRSMEIFQVEE